MGKSACAILSADLPALVVAPASIAVNWRREVEKWRPEAADQFEVVSYASSRLARVVPGEHATVIADEVHYAKTPEARRTKLACRLLRRADRAIALSGTLVPNRPIELWPLLRALEVTNLGFEPFASKFADAFVDQWGDLNARGASNLPALRRLLRPHVTRYRKEDVLPDLPEKTWRVVALDLPVDRRERRFHVEDLRRMPEPVAFEAVSEVLRLHGERKLPAAIEYVEALLEQLAPTGKVVVFAHHRDVVSALSEALSSPVMGREKFGPPRVAPTVIGGMSARAKQRAVDRFQDDPRARAFVGQVEAAGVGLNLTAAQHVVFVEASWVPSTLEQAADRCHRIGTRGNVTVDLLVIHASIDEHMLRRALEKLDVIESVVPVSEWQTRTPRDPADTERGTPTGSRRVGPRTRALRRSAGGR